jgi:class 3 adenylate cyclase/tetratricopeptide (TPR) repeat protein
MRCSKCGTEGIVGKRFCAECGSPLANRCSNCDSDNALEAKFCADCGAALSASIIAAIAANPPVQAPEIVGERRHLTVLLCDLVGSTALAAQLDPEEWRKAVVDYQGAAAEAVTRFGGHVARYVGDGVLAFFGYPEAHDNDAERAARAGLGLLDALDQLNQQPGHVRLSARIGIDSGAVVVGESAGQDADVFGEAPNVAARVQAVAAPGTVAISEATHRLISGLFVVEELGAQTFKGIARPVQLYRVIRPSGMRGRFEAAVAAGGLTRFVGREDELHSLMRRWERVREGEGQVVTIIGEPGIGKSRLVQEFRERIAAERHTWLEGSTAAFFQNTPFYATAEMLRQSFHWHSNQNHERRLAALEASLKATGVEIEGAVQLIASLLDLPLGEKYPPLSMPPDQRRRRLLATLVAWTMGAAKAQPLVIATEDLHWADPSTLEVTQLLIEQGATAPLMLIYTARPEFRAAWSMRAHHTQITLNRLSAGNVRAMVSEVVAQKALSEATVAAVVARTGGVPLFVEELTRAVLESGDGKLSGRDIPATLHDSLMARLDRLGAAKEVAQVGAVLGREFSYELLHAVHRVPEPQLQAALGELAEAELLYVQGLAPNANYQFKHALIRDAAYEALLKSRRKELHLSVARTIDQQFPSLKETHPEVLALHWTEAGEIESAIAAWQRAGDRAAQRGALPEAVRHFSVALDQLGSLPEDVECERLELPLQICLGLGLFGAKGFSHPEAYRALTRAQELGERLGETSQIIGALFGLSGSVFGQGRVSEAREFAERELRLAEHIHDRGLICAAQFQLGQALMMVGQFVEAQNYIDLAIANLDEKDTRQVVLDTSNHARVTTAGLSLWLGYPDRARRLLRETLQTSQKSGNYYHSAFAHMWSGFCFLDLRDGRALIKHSEALIRISNEAPFFIGHANFFGGWGLLILGKADDGIARLRQATAFWAQVDYRLQRPWELQAEAEFCVCQGEVVQALTFIEEALEQAGAITLYRVPQLTMRAELLARIDAPNSDEIEATFREAVECARRQNVKFIELGATTHFARWLKSRGRAVEARTMLAAIYNWFTEGFDTADLIDAKAQLEELRA